MPPTSKKRQSVSQKDNALRRAPVIPKGLEDDIIRLFTGSRPCDRHAKQPDHITSTGQLKSHVRYLGDQIRKKKLALQQQQDVDVEVMTNDCQKKRNRSTKRGEMPQRRSPPKQKTPQDLQVVVKAGSVDENLEIAPLYAIPEIARRISSKYGRDFLPDDKIRLKLEALDQIIMQYTDIVEKEPNYEVNKVQSFWDLPFRRRPFLRRNKMFMEILRAILDAANGVEVSERAQSLDLENVSLTEILQGFLSFLCFQTIQRTQSPFDEEGEKMLREGLEFGLSKDDASVIIQDQRLRYLTTNKFQETAASRMSEQVARFNQTILPLMGDGSELNELHTDMVREANDVFNELHAYNGTFEVIQPRINQLFDPDFHILENVKDIQLWETCGNGGQKILWVIRYGLRFQPLGGCWRVCSPATVILRR